MTTAYVMQVEELDRLLLKMASFTEEMLAKALHALREQDVSRAKSVMKKDIEIDQMKVEINQHIINFLAFHHPVNTDLRNTLAVLRISNHLERISDCTFNIAKAAVALSDAPHLQTLINIQRMSDLARQMLYGVIDSYAYRDAEMARAVKLMDDEMNDLDMRVQEIPDDILQRNPKDLYRAAHIRGVSANHAQIADLAADIAEDVILINQEEMAQDTAVPYQPRGVEAEPAPRPGSKESDQEA